MKRKALKGLLIVLIVLTFCFFFSGTVKTLTTAKVLFASVKTGKLKTQVMLTGYLTFSETQDITWENLPAGISMRVTEILIAKGQEVKTGDPLFQIEITGLSEAVKAQEKVYQEAEKGLLALENQYANLRARIKTGSTPMTLCMLPDKTAMKPMLPWKQLREAQISN